MLHGGDLICEGGIQVNAEPPSKPAGAGGSARAPPQGSKAKKPGAAAGRLEKVRNRGLVGCG